MAIDVWIVANIGRVINSAGLVLDIVGAFLVASEVVRQYRGKKYEEPQGFVISKPFITGLEVKETAEYAGWEVRRYRSMKCGLVCLTTGFLFQIVSTWLR